jgi:predicted DNA-binding transcriptional regulator AlpA
MTKRHVSCDLPITIPHMQQLLKPRELATLINVSVLTIMNWYYDGIIPARIHVGRIIRFELDAVLTALEQVREVRRADEFFRRRRPVKRIS